MTLFSKRSTKKNLLLASLLTTSAFTGCNSDTNPINLKEEMQKYDWKLYDAKDSSNNKISSLSNINKKKTFLSFKNSGNNKLYFSVGCNHHSAEYTLSKNNTLSTNNITGNSKLCESLDASEKKLIEILSQKGQLSITKVGAKNILSITLSDGTKLTWEPRAEQNYAKGNEEIASNLKKYNWILQSASQTPDSPISSSLEGITELEAIKDKVKLSINGNRLGYTTGCHQQSTQFELADKAILKLSNISSNVSCQSSTQAADNMLDQIIQQDTKISLLLGEIPTFTQRTNKPNERSRFLTWEAVDKSQADLKTSIDQFNWKLANALKQNSPVDSFLSSIPELIAVKDKVTLSFNFTPIHISYFSNNISYSAGCNNHTGKFTINQEDVLSVSDVTMTEKACVDVTASAETMLNDIIKKGGKLVMTMDNNVPTLTFTSGNTNGAIETLEWQGTVKSN